MLPTTAPMASAVPPPVASSSSSSSSSSAAAAAAGGGVGAGPPEAPVPAHEVAGAVGLYIATSITMVMVKYGGALGRWMQARVPGRG